MAHLGWFVVYAVGSCGLALAAYRLALKVSDTLEWVTRRRG
jgi:hypothetical protein